ncbi:MAG TPA: hypothetical protein VFX42_02610 [Gemmatimonadales bacterium]|nr:hypothetical protein [Gemmatimonadales bacterium]
MRRSISCVLGGAALLMVSSGAHAGWLFNLDVCQTFSQPQDNFEVCVEGNHTHDSLDQGVIAPPGWTVQRSYDAARNETCFSFVGPALPQQPSSARPWHFGMGSSEVPGSGKVKSTYWTRGPIPSIKPGTSCNVDASNWATTGVLTFVVSNDTESDVVLEQAGWKLFGAAQPLASMDRDEMPPDSLNPVQLPENLLLSPGGSFTFSVAAPAGSAASAICETTQRFPADATTDHVSTCPRGTTIWTQESLSPEQPPLP